MLFTDLFSKDSCPVCGQTPCNCTHITEGVAEAKADPTSTWVVYDGDRVKRFKTHQGAKAYAEQHGGKVASSAHYADKIQGKQGVAEASIPYALSAANANAEYRRQGAAGGGYRGRIDIPVQSREDYISAGRALKKAAAAAGQKIEYGLSNGVMSVFSDSMDADTLDQFIDSVLDQGVAEEQVNEISPYDFDSDADYYDALRAAKRRAQGRGADDYDDYEDEPMDNNDDDESYYEKYVRTKGLEEVEDQKPESLTYKDLFKQPDPNKQPEPKDELHLHNWDEYWKLRNEKQPQQQKDVAEGDKKPEPPEADYGDEYQAMVGRLKKLAGMGPLKTVYDPNKRVYKSIPTAVQPKQQPKK